MTNTPGHPHDLPQRVVEALWRGNRSEAIELLRREWNLDHEEARERVAAYILSNSSLQRRMTDSESETRWGVMRWLILLQAIAVAIGYFLFFRDQ
jgi:hypothetical protein